MSSNSRVSRQHWSGEGTWKRGRWNVETGGYIVSRMVALVLPCNEQPRKRRMLCCAVLWCGLLQIGDDGGASHGVVVWTDDLPPESDIKVSIEKATQYQRSLNELPSISSHASVSYRSQRASRKLSLNKSLAHAAVNIGSTHHGPAYRGSPFCVPPYFRRGIALPRIRRHFERKRSRRSRPISSIVVIVQSIYPTSRHAR
jgi:hypothetical protein